MLRLQTILLPLFLAVIAATYQTALPQTTPAQLISASVKLRVDADNTHSWGTGTIIDTREGAALILTCGHIFRESQGKGNIEVHLFGDNSTVKVSGTCFFYDLEIDLALVTIAPPCPVRAAPIAPATYQIRPSQQVVSVGCDSGGMPSVRQHQIMSVDRIHTPRENNVPFCYIQVSGAPVGGRSGGGLFSSEGYLIGVCNTADPQRDDGHFVPSRIIRHVLDMKNLATIYHNPSLGTPPSPQTLSSAPALATLTPLTPIESMPETPVMIPPVAAMASVAPMFANNRGEMSREEQATLEEIKRRQQDGDEVILIVRSRRNPEMPSEVFTLNGASNQFLNALVTEPPQSNLPSHNPVILSSSGADQPVRQPVSFPVIH